MGSDLNDPLHIASGDAMASVLRQAFPDARLLPWRESLCDGPTPTGVRGEAWVDMRTEWLATEYGLDRAEVLTELRRLEDALDEALGSQGGVVLWFGRDLHCQMNMLHAAWRLQALGGQGRLSLILVEEAAFGAEEARSRLPAARPLTSNQCAWLAEARKACGSETPDDSAGLAAFVAGAASQEAEQVALPDTLAALRLRLACRPAAATGPSRPAKTLLRLLAEACSSSIEDRAARSAPSSAPKPTSEDGAAFGDLFRRFGQAEPALGFGDWQVWSLLRRLTSGSSPLIVASSQMVPPGRLSREALSSTRFRITPAGRSALNGVDA